MVIALPPSSVKFNTIKYLLDDKASNIEETTTDIVITVDREYFNFEVEDGKIVYSIRTLDIQNFLLPKLMDKILKYQNKQYTINIVKKMDRGNDKYGNI
ncbi:MAG: hypothetical protein QXE05_03115 [Nitrososphaeria archaeon]